MNYPFSLPALIARHAWWFYSCFLILVAGIYFGSLSELLLDMDDARALRDNATAAEDLTYLFSFNKELGSGRLTADVLRFLAYLLVGNQPGLLHLFLVAVHTATTLLLTRLLWRLGTPLALSFMSGLLFLVNVAHFRAVHWISAQDYTLALALGCVTLLTYLRYREEQRPLFLGLFYLCLLLDAMAHLAIFFILPFFVYVLWRRGQPVRACLRHFAWPLMGAPLMVYSVLHFTSRSSSTWWSLERYASTHVVDLVLGCGRMLLWLPSRLWSTAHWLPLPLYEFQVWELYVGGLVLLLLALAIWKRVEPVDLWGVWILLSLLPFALLTEETVVSQLAIMASPSRYLYMATAGSSVLLAWGLLRLGEGASRRFGVRSAYVQAGLLVPILLSSYVYLKKVEAVSIYMSGRNYVAEGEADLGMAQMWRGLDHTPEVLPLEKVYPRLCLALMGTNEVQALLDDALELFPENALLLTYSYVLESMNPDPATQISGRQKLTAAAKRVAPEDMGKFLQLAAITYHNMGNGLYAGNDVERAILAYRRSLEFAPGRLNTLENLATALLAAKRWEEAGSLAQTNLQAHAEDPSLLYLNALASISAGKIDEAIALCRQALRIRPNGNIFYLLSYCYLEKRQSLGQSYLQEDWHEQDLEVFRRMLDLDLQQADGEMYARIGGLFNEIGELDNSVRAYRKALDRQPQCAAYTALGLAYLRQGDIEAARRAYAQGMQMFGAAEAERVGALQDLRNLIDRGTRVAEAKEILDTYWSE